MGKKLKIFFSVELKKLKIIIIENWEFTIANSTSTATTNQPLTKLLRFFSYGWLLSMSKVFVHLFTSINILSEMIIMQIMWAL